jgi:serine protease Do
LVNIRGEVIGMNTAINPAGQGIGFAIPINMVRKVAEELIEKGRVVRGYLGIQPQALTPELAEGLEIPNAKGILIGRVVEDTPAEKSGLKRGDVVTKLNGNTVTDVNEFRMRVADFPVGDPIKLEILREGKKQNVEVVLEERPSQEQLAATEEGVSTPWAGLRVGDLRDERARRFVDDPQETGVIVVDVEPGSPADDAGVQPGDIVKEIGNLSIENVDDYDSAVKKYREKKAVALLLKRGNQTLYVGLKP